MTTTQLHTTPQASDGDDQQHVTSTLGADEPAGTIWVDFGDGGSARWGGLSLAVLDKICAQLDTVKAPDTIT